MFGKIACGVSFPCLGLVLPTQLPRIRLVDKMDPFVMQTLVTSSAEDICLDLFPKIQWKSEAASPTCAGVGFQLPRRGPVESRKHQVQIL